jgi:hypothetical protein
MYELLVRGGLTGMLGITFFGICSLMVAGYLLFLKWNQKAINKVYLDLVLYLGGMALFFGIFWTTKGFYEVLAFIFEFGPISPMALSAGLTTSLLGMLWGGVLFLINYGCWIVLKVILKEKIYAG